MSGSNRRDFLFQAAAVAGTKPKASGRSKNAVSSAAGEPPSPGGFTFPRVFTGRQLSRIAFPLGGVCSGTIALGGRGQLRDWEMFNKPNKGAVPPYQFPAIWVKSGNAKPFCRVLESRITPPFEGSDGLGANNVPGLARLAGATFTGNYPFAHIEFHDPGLPVKVELEAFSPFIPHDPDDSGLPVAILRYRITNPASVPAKVSICFSIDNPLGFTPDPNSRQNEWSSIHGLSGLIMSNLALLPDHPLQGTFAISSPQNDARDIGFWRGWPQGRWWDSPLQFWDRFSADGDLGPEPAARNLVGVLNVQQTIGPGQTGEVPFLLSWHFPNRSPRSCGWEAPAGQEDTVIGNWYSKRFESAWAAAEYAATNLPRLEARTRLFATAFRESTLPPAVLDAASANLSTLASTTCFRTADGEFHGFEGSNNTAGCCFGNCTHVWNYETATAHLFPTFARSLRKASFGYSLDDAGAIHFRQVLPDGVRRSGFAAADGQMGQIIHAYMDWTLSGDDAWLRQMWPRFKKALEFAWVPGGWDPNKTGVLEGAQHTTYDVEFYGPNPVCGIYYLGALRAAEEMARAVGDEASATQYRQLFEKGRAWTDKNLFNGEFYIQKVKGLPRNKIAPSLLSDMGSSDTENPQYQVGLGCLADQLIGQCIADAAGLGPLTAPANIRKTMESIYRYNYKRSLADHDNFQRTYALNDEGAIIVCEYAHTERPRIPFPYFSEEWTGMEYATASEMMFAGLVQEGVEAFQSARERHDGDKRNPWNEPECGHHYARAMSSWSGVLALSGFHYRGDRGAVTALPRVNEPNFRCFWATGTGWGTFSLEAGSTFRLRVLSGKLPCRSCEWKAAGGAGSAQLNGQPVPHQIVRNEANAIFRFAQPIEIAEGGELVLRAGA